MCTRNEKRFAISEEKTRVCYEKEKEDFVSISHFVSLKNRGKHEKKDMKKGKRDKVFFFGGFFCSLPSLSKSVFFCSQNDLLVVKSNLIYEKRLSFFSSLKYFL